MSYQGMGALQATLAGLSAKCDHVEAVYLSPHAPAFIILAVMGRRQRTSGRDTIVEPLYPDANAQRELSDLVRKVREKFSDIHMGYVMSQGVFSSSWPEIYRRPKVAAGGKPARRVA